MNILNPVLRKVLFFELAIVVLVLLDLANHGPNALIINYDIGIFRRVLQLVTDLLDAVSGYDNLPFDRSLVQEVLAYLTSNVLRRMVSISLMSRSCHSF